MGYPKTTEITIPDLFSLCALDCAFNTHYDLVRPEVLAWITSYNLFVGKKQEHFIKSDIESLAGYAYPSATREDFRTICNIINVIYVGDMLTDEQDGNEAENTGNLIMQALASQECTESGSSLYQCVLDVAMRLKEKELPGFRHRLFEHYKAHLKASAREAELRSRNETLSLDDYTRLRRDTSAVRVCFDLIEFVLGGDIPSEVFHDEVFQRVCDAGVDMVAYANDLFSYNIEQSLGHNNANVLTVFMKEYKMSLQEAADHLGVVFQNLVKEYMESKELIRSYGPNVDELIHAYIQHVSYWVAGNLEWSFKSQRYFGTDSDEVRKSGVVKLLTKGVWSED